MGLIDKVLNKKDNDSKRKIGSKFSENEANEILDALDKHTENKKLGKEIKKEINIVKEVDKLIKSADNTEDTDEAVNILKKAMAISPENGEIYKKLAEIYKNNADTQSETEILKLGIKNISNNKIKNELAERLKKINN